MRLHSPGLHLHPSSQALQLSTPPHPCRPCTVNSHHCQQLAPPVTADCSSVLRQNSLLSRRALAIGGSLLPLLSGTLLKASPSWAADGIAPGTNGDNQEQPLGTGCGSGAPTKKAFFDVAIDGEPAGRIVVGLYGANTPAGAARFAGLLTGAAGISYRRKEFVKITPSYIQHGGVRSYGVDAAELARKRGSSTAAADELISEWERASKSCPGTKNVAGSLGIVIRDPTKPPPKVKLVARRGKLEIDEEEVGVDPNGTEFVISTKDSPELDASTLVVGRVLDGMEVVDKISRVKTVKENTGSPYFRVAKLIGDKRAVVAERGFNRPYSKVIITNCGLMD
uniref:Peptidyl-prolyl cis-trans isomerase CYP19-4 n=1 Tax=Anthurium amnicola TaxID=1678845 RepID=A0A1D1YJ14_9ARAE